MLGIVKKSITPIIVDTKDVINDYTLGMTAKQGGSILCFAPNKPLPYDTKVTIQVGPDIPSAGNSKNICSLTKTEGLEVSNDEKTLEFTTAQQFAVVQCSTSLNGKQTLRMEFNQPLVHNASLDTDWKWKPIISPDMKGKWQLSDVYRAYFEPEMPWPNSYKINLKIPKACTSIWADPLASDYVIDIESPTVTLQSFYPIGKKSLSPNK